MKTFYERSLSLTQCILIVFALLMCGNTFSQDTITHRETSKYIPDITILDSIKGKWAGFIISDSLGKITVGMNISVRGDSVFGNSTIQWPSKVTTQIFKGKFDRRRNSLTLFEPQEDLKCGVYQCILNSNNNKLSISGTWTRNRDNREFNCALDKVGDLLHGTQDPVIIIKQLIGNINEYVQKKDEELLRKVYSAWLRPEIRLGDFDNFKQGFSTTTSDAVIPPNDYLKKKLKINLTESPQKLDEVDGIFSFVSVLHEAQEYLKDGDEIKLQRSIYLGEYKLIVANGLWKILSGKATLVDRQMEDKKFTTSEFQKTFDISQISSILEIISISPNSASEGDTISINFVQNSGDELRDISVRFDSVEAKIVGDLILGQLKCIVPGGLNNDNPQILLRSSGTIGPAYNNFRIKSDFVIRWYVIALLIVFIIGIIIYASSRNRKLELEKEHLTKEANRLNEEKNQIASNITQFIGSKELDIIPQPDPEVPDELIEACRKDNCVLFASSELSILGGYPGAEMFVVDLINWSVENKFISEYQKDLLLSSVKSGRYDNAIENTIASLQGKGVDIAEYVRNIYSKPASLLPEVFKFITETSFSFYVSSNYDNLIENSFNEPLHVFTNKDTDKLRVAFTNRTPFIFKIYGRIEEPESLLLTPSQFSDAVFQNLQLSKFIENVFYSRMVFCLGADIDAIERFMNNINMRAYSQQKHFALVAVKGADWQTRAYTLERRYGIKIIPFTSGNYSQMENFMKTLSEKAPAVEYSNKIKESQHSPIRKLILKDIGPFEDLELDLDKNWNILLGDNGVGKSTILKSIAAGLCGEYAAPYADRLININSKTGSGTITIITDNNKYVTTVQRDDSRAKITTNAPSIIYGGALKIGFPPLRTITWETSGETYAGQDHPINEDILPIITGEIDPRMDKLKRWLIDLKGNSTGLDENDSRPRNKYANLIIKFFEIVRQLTPGMEIQYSKIDSVAKKVFIRTYDTVIPIESISQGTLSLTSWVGILLQRLYEIHGESVNDPTQMYALVLMDEIDAHMHPAWQQTVVHNLKKIFPNIQFVVSTHSPLVVGGIQPRQIIRFVKNEEGKAIKVKVEEEDVMGRADQLLTSKLFGLETTLDIVTQQEVEKYQELLGKEKRTPEEEEQYKKILEIMMSRIPISPEQKPVRAAQEFLQTFLSLQFGNEYNDSQKLLLEKAEKLFLEVQNKLNNKK